MSRRARPLPPSNRMYAASSSPSVVPTEMLPSTSTPSSRKAASDRWEPGEMRGRAMVITRASSTTTTTSEAMTKLRVKVASGPLARVWERMPIVAEGLRVTAMTPHRSPTPTTPAVGTPARKGSSGRAATKTSASNTKTRRFCHSVAQPRLRSPLLSEASLSSAPPARAMRDSASWLTGARSSTASWSTIPRTYGPVAMPASK